MAVAGAEWNSLSVHGTFGGRPSSCSQVPVSQGCALSAVDFALVNIVEHDFELLILLPPSPDAEITALGLLYFFFLLCFVLFVFFCFGVLRKIQIFHDPELLTFLLLLLMVIASVSIFVFRVEGRIQGFMYSQLSYSPSPGTNV